MIPATESREYYLVRNIENDVNRYFSANVFVSIIDNNNNTNYLQIIAINDTNPDNFRITLLNISSDTVTWSYGATIMIVGPQGIRGLKGDKGDNGADGAKGDKGDSGADGANGADGAKGDSGADGAKGDKGDKGDNGADGAKGDSGANGANGGLLIQSLGSLSSATSGQLGDVVLYNSELYICFGGGASPGTYVWRQISLGSQI